MRWKFALLGVFIATFASISCATQLSEQEEELKRINALIDQMYVVTEDNTPPTIGGQFSTAFKKYVEVYSAEAVDDATIDKIAGLLDMIRTRIPAAAALRQLGPRAKRAVPALALALDEHYKAEKQKHHIIAPKLSFGVVVCDTLREITPETMSKYQEECGYFDSYLGR